MLRQEIDPRQSRTIQAEAATALAHLDAMEREMRELETAMTEAGEREGSVPAAIAERYDHLSTAFEHGGGFAREATVATVLAGLGFDDVARERSLSTFSGGWLMRVELAKLFLTQPDVMLLDEPTNHLDLPAIQWFEETIDSFAGAVVIVSHDRTFLRKHVKRVLDLDGFGKCTLYEGGYDRYLAQRAERQEQLLARKANQDREIAQMERFVERFRAKSTKAKQAQSRIKALSRIERIEVDHPTASRMRMKIPTPPRSGEQVIRIENLHKSYDGKPVYQGVDFGLRRGDRVALAGPNGAGKSTLLRIVAGALDFDSGECVVGHNVRTAFFAQHQLEVLDPRNNVLEELTNAAQTDDVPRLRGHLGAFLFSGDDVEKKIGVLSGGEKARVALAKLLFRPANLLVLDEPTNHLDIPACEVLEEALRNYQGTLIFVSHDRAFINALATRVVEVEYGVLSEYLGNYDDYIDKKQRLEAAAARPARRDTPAAPPAPASVVATVEAATPAEPEPPKPRASKAERQRTRERRKQRDRIVRKSEQLEQEIAGLEQQVEALDWRLGDPAVASDAAQLGEIHAEQSTLREQIDERYASWERLTDELTALDDLIE
jgi:ATP-binding cassette subfamily F protein 3